MRFSQFFIGIFSIFIFSAAPAARSEETYKRHPVETGIIEYSINGNQTGHETVYFDQWGMREARYTKVNAGADGSPEQNTLTVMDADWIYSINLETKTGSKLPNIWIQHMKALAQGPDLKKSYADMLASMGSVKTSTETLLGKECELWVNSNVGSATWLWYSIPFKMKIEASGLSILIEATQFEENAKIDPSKFQIPEDAKITEATHASSLLGKAPAKA